MLANGVQLVVLKDNSFTPSTPACRPLAAHSWAPGKRHMFDGVDALMLYGIVVRFATLRCGSHGELTSVRVS